jgi:hypothetical protein
MPSNIGYQYREKVLLISSLFKVQMINPKNSNLECKIQYCILLTHPMKQAVHHIWFKIASHETQYQKLLCKYAIRCLQINNLRGHIVT